METEGLREKQTYGESLYGLLGGAVLWDFGNLSLWRAPCRVDSDSECRLGHTRISTESSKHCLTQGMCWAGVCSRPTLILSLFHASSRSCDPDEFTRELSRVFSFPVCGSYTSAHPNPVLCTMMQALIINQIIQPAFSNSCLIQSFLLSLLFDVCFHILFIAYNSSAAVNTELLIVMDFCYTHHYSVWILFNHRKCIFTILQRFSSHFTDWKWGKLWQNCQSSPLGLCSPVERRILKNVVFLVVKHPILAIILIVLRPLDMYLLPT